MSGERKVDAVNATIDSVGGAIGLLWDFLGRDPNPKKVEEPSTLSKIAGVASDVRTLAGVASEIANSKPAPREERSTRIPPIVIDTEGEEV